MPRPTILTQTALAPSPLRSVDRQATVAKRRPRWNTNGVDYSRGDELLAASFSTARATVLRPRSPWRLETSRSAAPPPGPNTTSSFSSRLGLVLGRPTARPCEIDSIGDVNAVVSSRGPDEHQAGANSKQQQDPRNQPSNPSAL
jgi:hypothetical protein